MSTDQIPDRELAERPSGYRGPNLSPVGLELETAPLADGVYALLANQPPKDNNGLIVGQTSALVVDAGITATVSRQIQGIAGQLTHVPVRYLVNTTYHGDHTFGNEAFPADVTVLSSRGNKEQMTDLAYEQQLRRQNMYGDESLLDDIGSWRKPDVTFDVDAEIDLGERIVELLHFGPGNGPGDTIVYVPDAWVAWTGNYLCHAGTAPMLLQGGPEPYLASLRRMRDALPDLGTIVPGHGPIGDGHQAIDWLMDYLVRLRDDVAALYESGHSMPETVRRCHSPFADSLEPDLLSALEQYEGSTADSSTAYLALCRDLHRLNILATYMALG